MPDLPEVEPRDPEPVAVAIETARALFRSGERLDALRWLRRAAERAEEAGDDVRSVSLARSAADLSTELQSLTPPPPPSPSKLVLGSAPPTSRHADDISVLGAYDDFSDKTVVDAKAPALGREAIQSGVQITDLPESQLAPRSVTMPSPSSSIPAVPRSPGSATIGVLPRPALRQAQRVSVRPDPTDPDGWLVRPLAEGVVAPAGSEEALLIALDPQSRLFE